MKKIKIQVYCNDVFSSVDSFDQAHEVIDLVTSKLGFNSHVVIFLRFPETRNTFFWAGSSDIALACFEDGEALRLYPCWQDIPDSYFKPMLDRINLLFH